MENNKTNQETKIQNMLNALADGQLPVHEREEILSMLDKDPQLSSEVCEIYRIKDLVKTAYPLHEFKQKSSKNFFTKHAGSLKIASAFFAFILTLASGFYIANNHTESLVKTQIVNQQVAIQKDKYIVFLSSSQPEKMTQVLYKAETLAQEHQASNGQVYVVTSAEGLDLLDKSLSPFEQKIALLSQQYPSIKFIACNNTMYRRKKEGKPVNLMANAQVVPSAVDFVATHLLKGWQYISI